MDKQNEIQRLKSEVEYWKSKCTTLEQDNRQLLIKSSSAARHSVHKRPSFKELSDEEKLIRVQSMVRGWVSRRKFQAAGFMALSSPLYKELKKRNDIMREIYKTEKNYLDVLTILVEEFLLPLRAREERGMPILKKDEIFAIFSTIEAVRSVSLQLYTTLTKEMDNWPFCNFGKCFRPIIPLLMGYSQYVNSYENAVKTLGVKHHTNKAFTEFVKKVESSPKCKLQDLFSLLLEPIQRIPRYILLFEELLKHTPDYRQDYDDIKTTLIELRKLTDVINENKRRVENLQKLVAVQMCVEGLPKSLVDSDLIYLREGYLEVKESRSYGSRYCFLLNKKLILSKFRYTSKLLTYDTEIPLTPLTQLREHADRGINLLINNNPRILRCQSKSERDAWLKELRKALA